MYEYVRSAPTHCGHSAALAAHDAVQNPSGPALAIIGRVQVVWTADPAVLKPARQAAPTEAAAHPEYGARPQRPSLAHAAPASEHVSPAQHGPPIVPQGMQVGAPPLVVVAHARPPLHALPAQHAWPFAPHAATTPQMPPAPQVSPPLQVLPAQHACPLAPHAATVPQMPPAPHVSPPLQVLPEQHG